ncbi:F0F1 ATP synthase subunit epsilon [Winogradskyella immobilis]|uniref:F0F1 ATP synthase subunit epsilon n=1 Tax=Winogradskyella immobilis TaxID=2816852 RepID=A0ABS8EQ42_9FLAO|nr:F0F1 ATP synthase subunit epsilon [Winogradskyella immobilis]MCC1485293.1 F0F1 ATP synthase subunit epsilon [Winogradskyella immobilis]MCG0017385.1 F0F1 ATP synthase subunit epsilon [Winogradskyella immobilis]
MYLEIVSPEATLFSGEVTSIAVPGVHGEFEMLNNHAPIVSLLKAGQVKIYGDITLEEDVETKFTKDANGTFLEINSGTIEMKDNKVIVLAD